MTRLVVNSVSCTAAFSQHAAVAALEGPWAPVEAMVASLRERRDLVVAGLNAIDGITCQEPAGAFYAFPRVADLGLPAAELADRLLADAGVAALGTAFGARRGLPAPVVRHRGRAAARGPGPDRAGRRRPR